MAFLERKSSWYPFTFFMHEIEIYTNETFILTNIIIRIILFQSIPYGSAYIWLNLPTYIYNRIKHTFLRQDNTHIIPIPANGNIILQKTTTTKSNEIYI